MKRLILLVILSVFLIVGCDKCPENKSVIGERCCLDADQNNVCDIDEVNQKSNVSLTEDNATLGNVTGSAVINVTINDTDTTINNTINQTTTTNSSTTTTTLPEYFDCEHTKLVVAKLTYYDGDDSKVHALLMNDGQTNMKGFRLKIYDNGGLEINKLFTINVSLNISELEEFNFELGDRDLLHENNSVNLIEIAPKLTSDTCSMQKFYDFDKIDQP